MANSDFLGRGADTSDPYFYWEDYPKEQYEDFEDDVENPDMEWYRQFRERMKEAFNAE